MKMREQGAVLRTVRLSAGYEGSVVLQEADLVVGGGEIVALVGPNGAGKSTLLLAVLGLLRSTGEIRLEGRDVSGLPAYRRASLGMAWIPEQPRVFPTLSVTEHILLAWESAGRPGGGLEELWGEMPFIRELGRRDAAKLSGGERKLLSVAAALVRRPRLLLADDPFLGVHPSRVALLARNLETARSRGTAILLTGQDPELLAGLASRAYLLMAGHVAASGHPRDVLASSAPRGGKRV